MTRQHRRWHAILWPILTVLLAIGLAAAFVARPGVLP